MDSNMDRTKHMLNYLYPIVGRANPELRDFMERLVITECSFSENVTVFIRPHKLCTTHDWKTLIQI